MRIISGKYKNRSLKSPKGRQTRPTLARLREAFFSMSQAYISDGAFLDIFSGSGLIGFEALSRGASEAVFIEKNRQAIDCIRQNIELLKLAEEAQLLSGDFMKILRCLADSKKQFSLIYADPPYRQLCDWKGEKVLYSEWVLYFMDEVGMLEDLGHLFLEEASDQDLNIENLSRLKFLERRKYGSTSLWVFSNRC